MARTVRHIGQQLAVLPLALHLCLERSGDLFVLIIRVRLESRVSLYVLSRSMHPDRP